MDPIALVAYIEAEWAELIAEVEGLTPAYIVGIANEAYMADPTLEATWAAPLADYYILRRALRAFTVDFDVSVEGDSYRLSQRRAGLQSLFDAAYAKVSWIGGDDDGTYGQIVVAEGQYLT